MVYISCSYKAGSTTEPYQCTNIILLESSMLFHLVSLSCTNLCSIWIHDIEILPQLEFLLVPLLSSLYQLLLGDYLNFSSNRILLLGFSLLVYI